MTVSPFDHPLLSGLLGDEETARLFSVEAEIAAMLAFERALAEAEAAEGIIGRAAARAIVRGAGVVPAGHSKAARRRGAATASWCRNWCARCAMAVGEPHGAKVHFGCDQPGRHRHRAGASPEA